MTAMAIGITAIIVVLVVLTPFAWWLGFQIYRDAAEDRRIIAEAVKEHQARHDYVTAVGATNQRGLEAPTGALEPAEIKRLLRGGR